MATGRQAFDGSTTAVVFDAILNRAPMSPVQLNPDTPPRLEIITRRSRRIATCATSTPRTSGRPEAPAARLAFRVRPPSCAHAGAESRSGQPATAPIGPDHPHTACHRADHGGRRRRHGRRERRDDRRRGRARACGWRRPVVVASAVRGWRCGAQSNRLRGLAQTVAEAAGADEEVRRARVRFDARDYRAALAEATAALGPRPRQQAKRRGSRPRPRPGWQRLENLPSECGRGDDHQRRHRGGWTDCLASGIGAWRGPGWPRSPARLRGMPEYRGLSAPRPEPRPAPQPAQAERRAEVPPTPPARPPAAGPIVVPPATPPVTPVTPPATPPATSSAGARACAGQPAGGCSGGTATARTGAAGRRTTAAAGRRGADARAVPAAPAGAGPRKR